MISYEPLWNTMKRQGLSTYYLRNKGGDSNISGSSIRRMQAGESVSTNTIDTLCKLLHCTVSDIIEYVEEEAIDDVEKPPSALVKSTETC